MKNVKLRTKMSRQDDEMSILTIWRKCFHVVKIVKTREEENMEESDSRKATFLPSPLELFTKQDDNKKVKDEKTELITLSKINIAYCKHVVTPCGNCKKANIVVLL